MRIGGGGGARPRPPSPSQTAVLQCAHDHEYACCRPLKGGNPYAPTLHHHPSEPNRYPLD